MEVFQEAGRWWIRHKASGKFFRKHYEQRLVAQFVADTHQQHWNRLLIGEEEDLRRNFVSDKSQVVADTL